MLTEENRENSKRKIINVRHGAFCSRSDFHTHQPALLRKRGTSGYISLLIETEVGSHLLKDNIPET